MPSATPETVVNYDIERPVLGYMLNTLPDEESRKKIADLQMKVNQRFGDIIWSTPPNTLHITLMDWVAPLVDYEKDKKILFDELFPTYDAALTQILKDYGPITVNFTEAKATPGAIIATGQDKGLFNDIRSRFLSEVELPPNTKEPPTIVHSTIARYRKRVKLEPIADFIAQHPLTFTLKVDHFRLVREDVAPQIKHVLLKKYPLS